MKELVFRNKKISYRTAGKGKAVMLLHGFAEDGNIWNDPLEKLSEKFYVVVPDLPGSGTSEMPEDEISIESCAEMVKAIAEKEIISKEQDTGGKNLFTLIGHSMGGYITLAFAEKYPGLLNAFGLFHSIAYKDDDAKKEARRKGIEFIKNSGVPSFLKKTTPNLFSGKTKKENPELVGKLMDQSKGFSSETLIQYYEAMIRRPDRTHVLKSFQQPILFIIGKDDTAVPLQSSLEQCHLPRISHIHLLQNSGHMGVWEEKDLSTSFLVKFLNTVH